MTPELLKIVETEYGLQNVVLLKRVEQGVLSNNYIIESNDTKYFLKHHRHNDLERIRKIHTVESFFSEKGFPVILSLPNKDNSLVIQIEEQYYSLLPFVDGILAQRRKWFLSSLQLWESFWQKCNWQGSLM